MRSRSPPGGNAVQAQGQAVTPRQTTKVVVSASANRPRDPRSRGAEFHTVSMAMLGLSRRPTTGYRRYRPAGAEMKTAPASARRSGHGARGTRRRLTRGIWSHLRGLGIG